MRISGFTIVRNALKYGYPVLESIHSILPICDEFIVAVGDSEDGTGEIIRGIDNPKIKIVKTTWDFSQGKEVLSHQTNLALKECRGDWAFYLQTDEVVHEADLPKLKQAMERYVNDESVDALRFKWFHFYGSYHRYRIDRGWYQKQDRIIKNNKQIVSEGDAWGFKRADGQPLRSKHPGAFIYHYGWVQDERIMAERRKNAEAIGFVRLEANERKDDYAYGDLDRFPAYFGTHPEVMEDRIAAHRISRDDLKQIRQKYWWFPPQVLKIRYKTGRRVKEKIE